jgi:hypothetical protein
MAAGRSRRRKYPARIIASKEQALLAIDRNHERRADCRRMMDEQIAPGRF